MLRQLWLTNRYRLALAFLVPDAFVQGSWPRLATPLGPERLDGPTESKEKRHWPAGRQADGNAPCDPILLPSGRKLVTLLDAATYATKLPKKEADTAEWQAAIESLMLVAELGEPTMFARIGIMKALNWNVERTFESTRKDTHWEKRKLKRGI